MVGPAVRSARLIVNGVISEQIVLDREQMSE